ncbi:hypothetical protein OIU79_003021 [Salix purpurea]|uniref:RING-type domain-containing protein n=1 Tax=Salix purpurea TaxID=77065 RepID=A0A9Q0UKI8_SALPP|nr:hypothetical protein OIU79_003021 [Salix purpurea]
MDSEIRFPILPISFNIEHQPWLACCLVLSVLEGGGSIKAGIHLVPRHMAGQEKPSFCLYTSSHESYHGSVSSLKQKQRSVSNQAFEDEKLVGVAREAKERLDGRLRMQKRKKAETTRHKNTENLRDVDGRSVVLRELQMEVYGARRGGSKRFNWAKLSWKAADQDECTICLDRFKSGETLVHLPCAHRYQLGFREQPCLVFSICLSFYSFLILHISNGDSSKVFTDKDMSA